MLVRSVPLISVNKGTVVQKYLRVRFHLASGAQVDRYNTITKGETMTPEDIKEMLAVFKHNMANIMLTGNEADTGGIIVPDMTGVLLVEMDVVTEIPA
jgi:hypothetical protein